MNQNSNSSLATPKISILVPIYNAESYLEKSLGSLVNQTLRDLEFICINDGSTDNSLQIIQQFAAKDPRIVIINKPNSGYGDSMNQGLKKARGEFIGILEPDDWIESDAFEKLYATAQKFHADVVRANFYEFRRNRETGEISETIIGTIPADSTSAQTTSENLQVFNLAPSIWSGIYRRAFLKENHINFLPTPGASYQDVGFNFKTWLSNPKTALLKTPFLHYWVDNASSSVNNPDKVNCVVEEHAELARFISERQKNPETAVPPEFIYALMAAKFANYLWNINRLSGENARNFFQTTRTEFRTAARNHQLKRQYFSKRRWLMLQLILHAPRLARKLMVQ